MNPNNVMILLSKGTKLYFFCHINFIKVFTIFLLESLGFFQCFHFVDSYIKSHFLLNSTISHLGNIW